MAQSSNPRDEDMIAHAAQQFAAAQVHAHGIGGDTRRDFARNDERSRPALLAADSIPGYELVGELHRGGQGVVYEGLQIATRRRVAIKVLHHTPFHSEISRARFEREVQIMAQLRHPHIVTIHDSSSAGDRLYYVMDLVSGQPVDRWVAARGDWGVRDSLGLFVKICEAVQAAHVRGVIHRDLKPNNVLVDEGAEPRVVDFGLAKLLDDSMTAIGPRSDLTESGQFVGSLPWSSPEQLDASQDGVDTRSDVYSLGVMLFQTLTGTFPYPVTGSLDRAIENIRTAEPDRPSAVARGVDRDLDTIVLKCLQKDPGRRYQTAGELGSDLQRYLAGLAIDAKRDSTAYVLRKHLHRFRWPIRIAGAFSVTLIAASVSLAVLWQQAATQRNEAAAARSRADQRFDQLRALAHTIIYDLDEKISDLPGSTDARLFVTQTARKYLDALAADPEADAELRQETALAYRKLGEVLGRLGRASLGRFAEAADVIGKSRAMLEELARENPDDLGVRRELRPTLLALGEVLRASGNHDGAAEANSAYYEVSKVIAERTNAPTDHRDVAMALLGIADLDADAGRADQALSRALEAARALESLPDDAEYTQDIRRDRSVAYTRVGDRYWDRNAHTAAREWYEKSLAIDQARLAAAPDSATARRDVTVDLLRIGDALVAESRAAEATPLVEHAVELREEALRQDADNAQALRDVSTASYSLAILYDALAEAEKDAVDARRDHLARALQALQRSYDLWKQMLDRGVLRASDRGAGDELNANIAEIEGKLAALTASQPAEFEKSGARGDGD